MYETVLVPVDMSGDFRLTIRWLSHLPGIREVVILHVFYNRHPSNGADPDREYRQEFLEGIVKEIPLPDVTVRTMIEEIRGGEIFEAINRVAAREGVPLILMGRRGRGIIDSLLLGSVASDVLRYGKTDLLLVNNRQAGGAGTGTRDHTGPELFSRALICTDFSDPEIASLCRKELPVLQEVTLFHAITTGDSEEEIRSFTESARAGLEREREPFARIPIPVQVRVSVGSAPEEIVAFSEHHDISIIVMKSTGKRGFLQNLLGSTTARVARHSRKPVLVLRRSAGHR